MERGDGIYTNCTKNGMIMRIEAERMDEERLYKMRKLWTVISNDEAKGEGR